MVGIFSKLLSWVFNKWKRLVKFSKICNRWPSNCSVRLHFIRILDANSSFSIRIRTFTHRIRTFTHRIRTFTHRIRTFASEIVAFGDVLFSSERSYANQKLPDKISQSRFNSRRVLTYSVETTGWWQNIVVRNNRLWLVMTIHFVRPAISYAKSEIRIKWRWALRILYQKYYGDVCLYLTGCLHGYHWGWFSHIKHGRRYLLRFAKISNVSLKS